MQWSRPSLIVRLNERPFCDPKFDIWVVYHPDTRRTRRLRLFADFIIDTIRSDIDLFEGRRGGWDTSKLGAALKIKALVLMSLQSNLGSK
jgi:hypothetical protein